MHSVEEDALKIQRQDVLNQLMCIAFKNENVVIGQEY